MLTDRIRGRTRLTWLDKVDDQDEDGSDIEEEDKRSFGQDSRDKEDNHGTEDATLRTTRL